MKAIYRMPVCLNGITYFPWAIKEGNKIVDDGSATSREAAMKEAKEALAIAQMKKEG